MDGVWRRERRGKGKAGGIVRRRDAERRWWKKMEDAKKTVEDDGKRRWRMHRRSLERKLRKES